MIIYVKFEASIMLFSIFLGSFSGRWGSYDLSRPLERKVTYGLGVGT